MRLQCFLGAGLDAFHAEDTLGSVFPFSGIVGYIHIHGADPFALSAGNALFLITGNADDGKIAHGLQKNRDRTDIFAERPVILAQKSQRDANCIVENVPHNESYEHDPFQISHMAQEKRAHKKERSGKRDMADEPDLFPWGLRDFVRQKIQDHRGPAGVAAPATAKQQRPKDLGDGIMDRGGLKHAGEQIVPEPFDLHVLLANQAEINQHVQADQKLHDPAGMLVVEQKKKKAQRDRGADIAEIQKIEQIAFGKPKCDRNDFKSDPQDKGNPPVSFFIHSAYAPQTFYQR